VLPKDVIGFAGSEATKRHGLHARGIGIIDKRSAWEIWRNGVHASSLLEMIPKEGINGPP